MKEYFPSTSILCEKSAKRAGCLAYAQTPKIPHVFPKKPENPVCFPRSLRGYKETNPNPAHRLHLDVHDKHDVGLYRPHPS